MTAAVRRHIQCACAHSSDVFPDIPTLSAKSREIGELQDMYRRALAASWAAQPGELQADECVEDIFAGGDGWGYKDKRDDGSHHIPSHIAEDSGSYSDGELRSHSQSPAVSQVPLDKSSEKKRRGLEGFGRDSPQRGRMSGRHSLDQQADNMKAQAANKGVRPANEIDELDCREDLRSWTLPASG